MSEYDDDRIAEKIEAITDCIEGLTKATSSLLDAVTDLIEEVTEPGGPRLQLVPKDEDGE